MSLFEEITHPIPKMREIPCACGCLKTAPMNRMIYVRSMWTCGHEKRPGLATWLVRKECAPEFERELALINLVKELVSKNAGANLLRRIAIAAQIYDAQCDIYLRRRGPAAARKIARYSVTMWILPECLGAWLHRRGWLKEPPEYSDDVQEAQA